MFSQRIVLVKPFSISQLQSGPGTGTGAGTLSNMNTVTKSSGHSSEGVFTYDSGGTGAVCQEKKKSLSQIQPTRIVELYNEESKQVLQKAPIDKLRKIMQKEFKETVYDTYRAKQQITTPIKIIGFDVKNNMATPRELTPISYPNPKKHSLLSGIRDRIEWMHHKASYYDTKFTGIGTVRSATTQPPIVYRYPYTYSYDP